MTQAVFARTLDNGLVLLGESMPWVESVAFAWLLPAGSIYDPPGRAGRAALTCEMAIRGCGPRDSRQFVDDLDSLGIERGEGVSDSHASFRGATLAANLFPALEIYADLVRRPLLPAEQLEAGRLVVLQELHAIEDEPAHKVMQELERQHFPAPWGAPSHGTVAGVEAQTIDDIRRHVAEQFRPNGAILAVAGNFEWDALSRQVERLLGDWPAVPESTLAHGGRGSHHVHLMHESAQTHLGIAFDCVPYRHPDYFQAMGAVRVLSGGMSARLFTEVREKRGLCYNVSASLQSFRDRAAVLCYSGTTSQRAQETLDVILGEFERLSHGIEPHELERVKARVKSGLIMQQESSSARSGSIARDWYHLGRVRSLDEVELLVNSLTCESIGQFLAHHPPRDYTIVTLGPQPLRMPDREVCLQTATAGG